MPTFGYTSIGGSSYGAAKTAACKFSIPENLTLNSIVVYMASTGGAANYNLAAYSDVVGVITDLLTNGSDGGITTTPSWLTRTVTDESFSSGDNAWLVAASDDTKQIYYDSGGTSQYAEIAPEFSTTFDATAVVDAYYDVIMSIYGNYTAASSGTKKLALLGVG